MNAISAAIELQGRILAESKRQCCCGLPFAWFCAQNYPKFSLLGAVFEKGP
jgi:hypothetical protein